jgi:hypothetical protein
MPQVGEIYSNMKRVTTTYDEELAIPQHLLDEYNSRPVIDRQPTSEEQEGIAREFELNYAFAGRQRWSDQRRFMGKENIAMRLVNFLNPHQVFRKLQQVGVDARIEAPSFDVWMADDETGKPVKVKRERTTGRIWLADNAINGRLAVSGWAVDKDTGLRSRRQVTTLHYGYAPEWSLIHFDEFDVPITESWRGWRTALMQMILADVLTEDEVNRAFGPVPLHSVSLHYRQQLQTHRRRKAGLLQ